MNGVSQSNKGVAMGNPAPANEYSPATGFRVFVIMLVPCLAAVLFSVRDSDAPALIVKEGRPSLVFQSYLMDEGPDPIKLQPMITSTFVFRNKGEDPVRITEMVPSCGCLSPVVFPREIPPGEEGRVTLPIKTRNEAAGLHEYMVTVKYEDPEPREVALTYNVVLPKKLIEIEPRVLMVMGHITAADRNVITISDYRPESLKSPMKIINVDSSLSIFTAQLSGQSTADGVSRSTIEVGFAESIPVGQHKGVITVSSSDENFPTLQIPVILGDRRRPADEPVAVSPETARVIVDSGHPEKSQGATLKFDIPSKWTFSHFDTFPPQVVAKVLSSEAVSANVIRMSVELSLTALPARGVEQGNLILQATDGEEAEMITVPVTLMWKGQH